MSKTTRFWKGVLNCVMILVVEMLELRCRATDFLGEVHARWHGSWHRHCCSCDEHSWSLGWFRLNLLFASVCVQWSGYLWDNVHSWSSPQCILIRSQYGKSESVFVFDSTSSFVFDSCLWITCSLSPSCSLNLILCSTLSFLLWRSHILNTSILIWIQEIGFICWLLRVEKRDLDLTRFDYAGLRWILGLRSLVCVRYSSWVGLQVLRFLIHHFLCFLRGSRIFGEMSVMFLQLCVRSWGTCVYEQVSLTS